MERVLSAVTVFAILTFALAAGSQANSIAQSGLTTYHTTKLIGLTVTARDGEQLGQIFDLVVDSHGRVDFAIVNQPAFEEFPGRSVVVPFSILKIAKLKSNKISVIFNADKEKFYEGPDWGYENLTNPRQAASVDRYYGIQPYWTEGTGKATSHK